jgi:hypothetical protein
LEEQTKGILQEESRGTSLEDFGFPDDTRVRQARLRLNKDLQLKIMSNNGCSSRRTLQLPLQLPAFTRFPPVLQIVCSTHEIPPPQ